MIGNCPSWAKVEDVKTVESPPRRILLASVYSQRTDELLQKPFPLDGHHDALDWCASIAMNWNLEDIDKGIHSVGAGQTGDSLTIEIREWEYNSGDPVCTRSKPCAECHEDTEYARGLIAGLDRPGMGFFNIEKEQP